MIKHYNTPKKAEKLKDNFHEFINNFKMKHISYKFLPNLILEKLLTSLDVEYEIDLLESKVNRLNNEYQNNSNKNINIILFALALISVLSIIYDFSEWLVNLGFNKSSIYPAGSLSVLAITVIIITVTYIFIRKK